MTATRARGEADDPECGEADDPELGGPDDAASRPASPRPSGVVPKRQPSRAPKRSRYRVFLSYSHASDRRFAPALQSALQRFTRPWYRPSAFRVFRDETSLSATPALWPTIQDALNRSDYFLLLASPEAAESPWIEREVAYWLDQKGSQTMILALTAGEISWKPADSRFDPSKTNALPPAVLARLSSEPLFVDFRWASRMGRFPLDDPKFLDGIASIAAPLQGISKDELVGEDVRQKRRSRRIMAGAVSLLFVLATVAVLAAVAARQRGNVADQARQAAQVALARSDFVQGIQALQRDRFGPALARFARSLRNEPQRQATASAIYGLLTRRWIPQQVLGALRHGAPVLKVAFSSDGARLATAGGTTVRLWNAASGEPVGEPLETGDVVTDIQFSPDGARLLTASTFKGGAAPGVAHLWNAATGERIGNAMKTPTGMLWTAQFSPDGKMIATASAAGVDTWDAKTGAPLRRLLELRKASPPRMMLADNIAASMVFSPDSARIYAGFGFLDPGVLYEIEAKTGIVLKSRSEPESPGQLAISPDGAWLLVTSPPVVFTDLIWRSRAGHAQLRSARTLEPVSAPMVADARMTSGSFSPASAQIITTAIDGKGAVWSYDGHEDHDLRIHHEDAIASGAISPDGLTFLTASHDGTARLWHLSGDRRSSEVAHHESAVTSVAFSPDGRRFATGCADGSAFVWSAIPTQALPLILQTGARSIEGLRFVTDGSGKVVTWSDEGAVTTWDSRTGVRLSEQTVPRDTFSYEISPDRWVEIAGNTVTVRDARTAEVVGKALVHEDRVLQVALSPDGRTLLTASADKTARTWSSATGEAIGRPLLHDEPVLTAVFDPKGTTIATGSGAQIRFWDVSSHEQKDGWENHLPGGRMTTGGTRPPEQIVDLQFSANGKRLLARYGSASVGLTDPPLRRELSARQAQLWSVEEREPIAAFAPEDDVSSAAFTRDDHYVFTTSETSARFWDATTGEPVGPPVRQASRLWHAEQIPSQNAVLIWGWGNDVRSLRIPTGELLGQSLRHPAAITAVKMLERRGIIATGCEDGAVRLWDASTSMLVDDTLQDAAGLVVASPDEGLLAAAADGEARVWSIGSRQLTRETAIALADLAEEVGQYRVGENGFEVRFTPLAPGKTKTGEPWRSLIEWMQTDVAGRTIAPGIDVSRSAHIAGLISSPRPESRFEAVLLDPGNTCALSGVAALMENRAPKWPGAQHFRRLAATLGGARSCP